jgi:hypothetical protein
MESALRGKEVAGSEEEEDWETCSESEHEDPVDRHAHEFASLTNISRDIFKGEDDDFLLRICPDIFFCEIQTSFVNNREWRGAHWCGPHLRVVRGTKEGEVHRNRDSEEESEEESDEEEGGDLASVLHSWDWPQRMLWDAALSGDLWLCREALRAGACPRRGDPGRGGRSALLLGAAAGRWEVVRHLLAEEGAGEERGAALVVAAGRGAEAVVGGLLGEAGGDIYSLVR